LRSFAVVAVSGAMGLITARVLAQSAPAVAPVPVKLGTRDPSRFVDGPARVATRPAKQRGSASTASKSSAVPAGDITAAQPATGRVAAAVGSTSAPAGVAPSVANGKGPAPAPAVGGAPAVAEEGPAAESSKISASDAALAEFAKLNVKGLTGTLNKGDIHQTMEQRQPDFDACVAESRRSLGWVSGAMRFAFKVDAEGRIAEVRTTSSTIGHRALEQCITSAVASTQFPKPAGRATAQFSWGLSVDPVSTRAFATASPKPFTKLARKQARELFETCGIKRRRARFKLTAYIAAGGRVLSAGAIATPAHAEDKVDCVLEQFASWHLPKLKKASKLSFELR
jgi:hypothetical protein